MARRSFKDVLARTGIRPTVGDQNATRHYSETFSKELALWIRGLLEHDPRIHTVLTPEAPVRTCYGKKSLDVGCLDESNYLALDISIKTFNFRDAKTGRYSHNFTGRFYELLGEGLDLRQSYPAAVLCALVFLPTDGCDDWTPRAPSSFGHAVSLFSKIAGRGKVSEHSLSFEYLFFGLHEPAGIISFFDGSIPPPRKGPPPIGQLLSVEAVLERLLDLVKRRSELRTPGSMNVKPAFRWAD